MTLAYWAVVLLRLKVKNLYGSHNHLDLRNGFTTRIHPYSQISQIMYLLFWNSERVKYRERRIKIFKIEGTFLVKTCLTETHLTSQPGKYYTALLIYKEESPQVGFIPREKESY